MLLGHCISFNKCLGLTNNVQELVAKHKFTPTQIYGLSSTLEEKISKDSKRKKVEKDEKVF